MNSFFMHNVGYSGIEFVMKIGKVHVDTYPLPTSGMAKRIKMNKKKSLYIL